MIVLPVDYDDAPASFAILAYLELMGRSNLSEINRSVFYGIADEFALEHILNALVVGKVLSCKDGIYDMDTFNREEKRD